MVGGRRECQDDDARLAEMRSVYIVARNRGPNAELRAHGRTGVGRPTMERHPSSLRSDAKAAVAQSSKAVAEFTFAASAFDSTSAEKTAGL
jgi:hypothetical protein